MLNYLLIDLDGTLYPIREDNDYEHHVRQRVFQFMHERLGVPQADAYDIWHKAFAIYNQSLRALKETGYVFEAEEYWNFVRQGAENFLTPDPEVRKCLESLPQRKWLFTNANDRSARQCIQLLGLEGIFEGIISADSMGDCCKPEKAAFEIALEISGADPSQTVMFEDSFKNLRTAKELGMTTVLLTGETAVEEGITPELPETTDTAAGPELDDLHGNPQTHPAVLPCTAKIEGVVDAVIAALTERELRKALPSLWHGSIRQ